MKQDNYIREEEDKKKGAVISTFIHVLILLLCLSPFLSFKSEKPKQELSGIFVAVGNPNAAEKLINPQPSSSSSTQASPSKSKKVSKPKASKTKTSSASKSSKKVTSDIVSETLVEKEIVAVKKTSTTPSKVENNSQSKAEARAQREAEEKKRKKAEANAKAEAEARAKAEAKARAEAEAKAKKDAAKSKFSSLMNNSKSNAQDSKGDPNGKPDGKVLEGISTGYGRQGDGLGDRQLLYAPQIKDNTQKTGKVIINICVDQSGKVTKAKYTQKGSTTTDSYLIQLAEKSAKKYKFDKSDINEQCGDVVIDFKLK